MTSLYDEDILLWSERQRDLLRRVAAGEPVNEAPDWPNIIEEVESVGRSPSIEPPFCITRAPLTI
ncbi:DUF29 family protein [Rhodopila sp.]|uniref:DUF29 family protein n=1 Tax=Rhodopila sp. TaxID=2480087 RepID=UPI003D09E9F0